MSTIPHWLILPVWPRFPSAHRSSASLYTHLPAPVRTHLWHPTIACILTTSLPIPPVPAPVLINQLGWHLHVLSLSGSLRPVQSLTKPSKNIIKTWHDYNKMYEIAVKCMFRIWTFYLSLLSNWMWLIFLSSSWAPWTCVHTQTKEGAAGLLWSCLPDSLCSCLSVRCAAHLFSGYFST